MATGGVFLFRALEQKLPQVLEQRFRNLPFENGTLVPTQADLQPGTMEIVRDLVTQVGDADIISDGAFDIPTVDLSASEDRYRAIMLAAGFSYTMQQMNAYEKGMMQVNDMKMRHARRAIAERANKIGAYGDTRVNFTGFLNNANVSLNNSSFNPWTATADELVAFFLDELEAISIASNNVEYPNRIVLSPELHFLLIKTRMSNTETNVKEYILGNSSFIQEITDVLECRSANLEANGVQAGSTNKDRIVFYTLDPLVVERHIELTKLAPPEYQEVRGFRKVFPMYMCTTPVIINYPGALKYIDVAKKP